MLQISLFPWQQEALDKIGKLNEAICALDAGLGKTLTAVYHFINNRKEENLLIIAKKTFAPEWVKTINKFYPDYNDNIILLDKGSALDKQKLLVSSIEPGKRKIFITNSYSSFYKWPKLLGSKLKDKIYVVFDECQYIKGRTSKAGKMALAISQNQPVLLMSGTPVGKGSASNADLFNYMRILKLNKHKEYYNNWQQFQNTFLITKEEKRNGYNFTTFVGNKNEETIMKDFKAKGYFLKRSERDKRWPEYLMREAIEKNIEIEKDLETYKILKKQKAYNSWVSKPGSNFAAFRTACSGFVYGEGQFQEKITEWLPSNPKKQYLKELVESTEDKFIVFYNFTSELTTLKEVAKELNLKLGEINGQKDDRSDKDIIAIQYQSGAEGIDGLQDLYNRIIFYSPVSICHLYLQAKARIDRIGQSKSVFIYNFITKNSVETRIFENIKKGQDYTEKLFEQDFENNDTNNEN